MDLCGCLKLYLCYKFLKYLAYPLFCGCFSSICDDRVFYTGTDDVTCDKVSR